MSHIPPFLLILALTLLHFHVFHAIPVGEEQRHQTVHGAKHSDPAPQPNAHPEVPPLARSQYAKSEMIQEREFTEGHSPSTSDDGDELFKDISPKALAAVLLQALNTEEVEQGLSTPEKKDSPEEQKVMKEETENEGAEEFIERVKSRTRNSDEKDELKEDVKTGDGEDMESVKSLLQELQSFESPPKRELDPPENNSLVSEDLKELRELLGFDEQMEEEKRSPLNPVPHTSRRLGEEEEGEKLASVAQDLLLQYLLNGGENEEGEPEDEEGEDKENEEDYLRDDLVEGQQPLFEDEEEGNILQKRSNEYDDDEVDPQTIDKLIELSNRLHLPADDVVDIISDVEKRKRRRMKKKKARDDFLARRERTRTPYQTWPDTPKSTYYARRRKEQEPLWSKISAINWKKKSSEPAWNQNKMSGYTWSKMSGPTWKQMSSPKWNKMSEPSWNRVPDQSWNKVPEQGWNKVSEHSWNEISKPRWNKMSEPSWNKVSDSNWNKVSEPSWNKVSNPNWNKVSVPSWKKVSEPSWNKLSEPSWNKVSEPSWNKVSDQNWNKVTDENWNNIPNPSWNNLPDTKWNRMEEPTWNKVSQPAWNKLLEPRRYRARPSPFTNYIRPRTFQAPPRYYYKAPGSRNDYFDDDQDKQEEMENYIEGMLLTHPEVFQ